ncbi:MAG: acyl-CoA/acyl-ACP dehydrogenase [Streptosporangiales bacterium]|nr:acyl-CoA/acyl-ACP dehydrogenase [Streptosporangiales bacterium]
MFLDLTSDQEFFQETTAKFLADQVPPATLQGFADGVPADFEARYWRRGADLGWTSLLVSEDAGGGSISGRGLEDLCLIAYEFGRHAAPGPLVPASLAAAALGQAGTHPEALAELLAGTATAAWCHAEPSGGSLDITSDGGDLVLNGAKRPAEAAGRAKYLLVTGRLDGDFAQVLVPAAAPGVTITPLRTPDYSRDFAAVAFDGVRVPASAAVGPPGQAGQQVAWQAQAALVLAAAESAGAMRAGFDMTLAWASDRYSFGRPLASYQALKHRLADMATWLEASCAIAAEAAAAVRERSPDAAELASAAKAYTGQYGTELMHECVQLHGGIGLTREHDLHLYLRRVVLNRALHGTPAEHRQRIADHVVTREGL